MQKSNNISEQTEKHTEVLTHEDGMKLLEQNEKLKEELRALKKANKKLQRDLEHQEELIHKMNEGGGAKILTSREIDKLLDVVDDDDFGEDVEDHLEDIEDADGMSEGDIMAVFENFNNRLLRLEHIIGVQSDGSFVTDESDGEYDHDKDEYNKHTVTLKRACACLSQEEIDELIEYFKRGEDWIPSAFRKKA